MLRVLGLALVAVVVVACSGSSAPEGAGSAAGTTSPTSQPGGNFTLKGKSYR